MLEHLIRRHNHFHFDWITKRAGKTQDAFSLQKNRKEGSEANWD